MKNHNSIQLFLKSSTLVALCSIFLIISVSAQQVTPAMIQQAKSQLGTMTPDQIDAKIKEYGMTRSEAEAKAKEYGVDLESFLTKGNLKSPVKDNMQIDLQTIGTGNSQKVVTKPAEPSIQIPEKTEPKSPKKNQTERKLSPDGLDYYGYSLFQSSSDAFEPRPFIDDQYVLGEGDVIKISLSGELQSYNEYTVNSEGRILVSGIGPILVSGSTVDKAKRAVTSALGGAYSGLVRNPPTIFMDLSVARIRPIRVFMTGEIETPGGYAVSNFGNVFNSLFAVGGPKISGSLRDIRVIRNNKVITKVDIYDYLIGSPKTDDVRINDNDIIFVPLRGKTVSIKGEVLRPYTFELLSGENLKKLIEFSGGIRSSIYVDRIQVDRIIPFAERVKGGDDRKIYDIEFKDIATGKKDYTLEDGDIVTLFPILDKKENFVDVDGDVRRPGRYQIDKVKTIKDLITAADGLMPTVYMKRAELMREFPDHKFQMVVLDLEKVMSNDPSNNMTLQKKDKIKIYSIFDLNPPDSITVVGHSKRTGKFAFADSMTVGKLLLSLVGLEDSVYRSKTFMDRGDVYRLNSDKISRTRIEFNINDILDKTSKDLQIVPDDQLRIYGLSDVDFLEKEVEIFGNVKKPGKYPLSRGMTVTDLIMLAGGYTQDAWTQRGEVARVTRSENLKDSLVTVTFTDLPDLFDTTKTNHSILLSKAGSFTLIDKDQVFIRPHPDYALQKLVSVNGQVRFPGKYAISVTKERLSDFVVRAGGLQKNGYARGGELIRDGERLRSNFEEALSDRGGKYDPVMYPGDSINIPINPNTVRVTGEVNNPGRYSFVPKEDRDFYIDLAGGITDSADFALITYPEGYIVKTKFPWIFTDSPEIPDGSEIHVVKVIPPPPKTVDQERRSSFVEIFKETTAIIATSLTILVLAAQLNK
ncbi:MAG: SLBB domain-containing protein [Bacteroidota bacterium]